MSRYSRSYKLDNRSIAIVVAIALAAVCLVFGALHLKDAYGDLEVEYGNQEVLSGTGGYLLDEKDLVFTTNKDNVKASITLARDVTINVDGKDVTLRNGTDISKAFDIEIEDGEVTIESITAGKVFQSLYPRSEVQYSADEVKGDLFRLTLESLGDEAFFDFSCFVPVVEGVEVNGDTTV